MEELIKREDAIEAMAELQGIAQSKAELTGISKAWKRIKVLPTVDAVPVVRCKECVHRDPEDHRCDCGGHEWLKGRVLPMPDDWFCADGERREE